MWRSYLAAAQSMHHYVDIKLGEPTPPLDQLLVRICQRLLHVPVSRRPLPPPLVIGDRNIPRCDTRLVEHQRLHRVPCHTNLKWQVATGRLKLITSWLCATTPCLLANDCRTQDDIAPCRLEIKGLVIDGSLPKSCVHSCTLGCMEKVGRRLR